MHTNIKLVYLHTDWVCCMFCQKFMLQITFSNHVFCLYICTILLLAGGRFWVSKVSIKWLIFGSPFLENIKCVSFSFCVEMNLLMKDDCRTENAPYHNIFSNFSTKVSPRVLSFSFYTTFSYWKNCPFLTKQKPKKNQEPTLLIITVLPLLNSGMKEWKHITAFYRTHWHINTATWPTSLRHPIWKHLNH